MLIYLHIAWHELKQCSRALTGYLVVALLIAPHSSARRQDQGTSCGAQTVSVVPVLLPVMPSVFLDCDMSKVCVSLPLPCTSVQCHSTPPHLARIGVSPGPVQFCEPRAATGSSSSNPTLLGRI